jgi:hypothetical protein
MFGGSVLPCADAPGPPVASARTIRLASATSAGPTVLRIRGVALKAYSQ